MFIFMVQRSFPYPIEMKYFFRLYLLLFPLTVNAQLSAKFDRKTMLFAGSPVEQARYLLRPVLIQAQLGPPLISLPPVLQKVLTNEIAPPVTEKIKAYLVREKIAINAIGGDPDLAMSKNVNGVTANYFVIHDTSTPLYPKTFPLDIDQPAWKYNNFALLKGTEAHVFVNRAGGSLTQNDFNVPWRATKLESKVLGLVSRGNFIHIELIMPRRSDPNYRQADAVAPVPGFTKPQLKRLALLYVIASARKHAWLVPVYHAVLDEGISDGHDDPQHFDLNEWSEQIGVVLAEINEGV